jgi:hypothetical protein
MARIVALLVVAVLAAAPLAAAAAPEPQQSPLQQAPAPPQNQVGEQPAPTQAPQQAPVEDGSIGGREALLVGVGIVALIGGIWFVISRDAKRATAGLKPAHSAPRASRGSRRRSAAERKRRKRGRATK